MEQIQIHCEAENVALAMVGSDSAGVCIMVLGDQERFAADQAAIIAAHILLEAVITGVFAADNDKLLEKQEKDKSIPKENMH